MESASTTAYQLIQEASSCYLSLGKTTGSQGVLVTVIYPPYGNKENRADIIQFQPMQKASFTVEESAKICLESGSESRLVMITLSDDEILAMPVSNTSSWIHILKAALLTNDQISGYSRIKEHKSTIDRDMVLTSALPTEPFMRRYIFTTTEETQFWVKVSVRVEYELEQNNETGKTY